MAVVIPTRNRAELVTLAVRSVLAQSHRALDVVVVDDASDDSLVLPEDVAADGRVRVIRRSTPVGAAEARNLAVRETTAALIAFLDDDDAWRPQKIERQVAALEAAPGGTAAVETGFDLWEEERLVMRYLPAVERDLYRTLLERPALQPSTVLLRRAVFDELGGFDAAFVRTEDWYLWVQLAERYRVEALPEVHVDRLHNRGIPPAELLHWYARTVESLEPRIAALPGSDRRRVRSTHAFVMGVLALDAGNRRRAVGLLGAAWRDDPRRLRPLAHLTRAAVGDRSWRRAKAGVLAARAAGLRALGRDPALRRW